MNANIVGYLVLVLGLITLVSCKTTTYVVLENLHSESIVVRSHHSKETVRVAPHKETRIAHTRGDIEVEDVNGLRIVSFVDVLAPEFADVKETRGIFRPYALFRCVVMGDLRVLVNPS